MNAIWNNYYSILLGLRTYLKFADLVSLELLTINLLELLLYYFDVPKSVIFFSDLLINYSLPGVTRLITSIMGPVSLWCSLFI